MSAECLPPELSTEADSDARELGPKTRPACRQFDDTCRHTDRRVRGCGPKRAVWPVLS